MSPAFSSTKQAAAFALLLLVILLSPLLAGKWLLPTREQMYSSVGRETIDFPNFHQQIFEEKGDIDIAFMGSSRMGCAIDSAYVQDKLSEALGRKAVVRSLTWTWNGYDALYFIAQDLLQHRKVRMMVITDLSPGAYDTAHHQTSYWFRYADNAEALAGLPLQSKASFYSCAILGLPRNFINLLRPNLEAIPPDTSKPPWFYSSTNYTPQTSIGSSDVRIYSDATKASFHFSETPLVPLQGAFVRKIGLLAQQYQTQLVFIHIPDFVERKATLIEEPAFWPDAFGINVPMVGIAPATLFSGLTDDQILELYHNPTHFDQNGRNYLTPLVTPSLIQIYEDQNKP